MRVYKIKDQIAAIGLIVCLAVFAPGSARAHEVMVCSCNLLYNANGELRHPEDAPFVSIYDGLQKVIPEQTMLAGYDPTLKESTRVRLVIEPFANSDISVTGVSICDAGSEFSEIVEAVYKSSFDELTTIYGLPNSVPQINLLDIATIGSPGVIFLFKQGDNPVSN